MIPVIDLAALAFGQIAKSRTSTRLVLVHYRVDAGQPKRLLGLIIEQATDMLRCAPDEFKDYGTDNPEASIWGRYAKTRQGLCSGSTSVTCSVIRCVSCSIRRSPGS